MSTSRSRLRRPVVLTLCVAFAALGAVGSTSCKKGAGAIEPGGGGASGGEVSDATELRYKPSAAKLAADVKFTFKATTPQGVGEATGDLSGVLDLADAGGKLKVAMAVTEVRDFVLGKDMIPAPAEGEEPVDPKAAAQAFTGAFITDLRGELDEDATKALPETAAAKDKKGAHAVVASFATGIFGLPELPKPALVVGKQVETSERKDENLQGLVIPVDTTSKYTLVKIDSASGKRIAEVHYEAESSGAIEQGKQMITLDVSAEGTMLFDLDAQLPVRRTLSSTTNISAGQMNVEIVNTVESNYSPA